MNAEDRAQVNELLGELREILDQYNYNPIYYFLLFASFIVISIIVIVTMGEFWYLIFFLIIFYPDLWGKKKPTQGPSDRDLAEAAAFIMQKCINIARYSPQDIQRSFSFDVKFDGNLELYQEFAKYYPSHASMKLRSLSKIPISKV